MSASSGLASKRPASQNFAWRDQARGLIDDLLERSPAIYWTDFLLSAGIGWAMTAVYFLATPWSALQIGAFLLAAFLFFRAGTFIHEIVHMPSGQMVWFKRAWNILLGVPFLMPWVMYSNHVEHHNHRRFGTPTDGEYLPLGSSPIGETVKYLAQAPLLPLFMMVRFGVLGPLSWFNAKLRHWVLTRASAAVSNPYYSERFPKRFDKHLKIVEALCFAFLATLAMLVAFDVITGWQVFMGYLLLAFTLGLNWVRNLAAHKYVNDGTPMDHAGQVEESINITGQTWLTVAFFPVGLRYHALHHLFPALPYHNMDEAHRRLMQHLPADASYRLTNRDSFFTVVGELWQSARNTRREESAMRAWLPRSNRS
ncbi:fatty acid desaturase [Xylophilus sp. GOD-11R]|uniref:fatty acid desaturase family protein n=1 Tax=Xylophilus sp. GOD-11R TaxID=3089814 RepID=UPI00298BEAC8|nr:fatty acid desaturase [Xylophilus sp. GOD-11R]WPB58949.1 fatty acid desaturase [Xylophilus sp. GOD-11R]